MMSNTSAIIINGSHFDPKATFECGQVFRYKNADGIWYAFSEDKICKLSAVGEDWLAESEDIEYFKNYFDLSTDYGKIIEALYEKPFMRESCNEGRGIRILRQSPFETLINFIISANNNIPRIKKIIEAICRGYGKDCGDYFAFPTAENLAGADESFYKSIGAGYRSKYLFESVKKVAEGYDLDKIFNLDTTSAIKELKTFLGVGDKVADCILLFAYAKTDSFPVDTWVRKIYADIFADGEEKASVMRAKLVHMYGNLSGYAQQYLFYHKRSFSK